VTETRFTDYETALIDSLHELVLQCHNVIEAWENRHVDYRSITLNEAQEIAVLRIRLDDLADVQATGRAEAS
jgi:hypothetical protein